MSDPSALGRLTRRLNWIGATLLAAAALAFVWAVGFTSGVDGLLEGLIVSGAGLFVPGIALLWVSWIIGSAAGDEAEIPARPADTARPASGLLRLRDYAVAVVAVIVAAIVRDALTPFVGGTSPFATFFLAVAVAAWVGGMGPAVLAAALSVPIVWKLFLDTALPPPGPVSELVGLGMFLAVALSIAGITSALRLTQLRAATLRAGMTSRLAEGEESERRFEEIADRSASMLWIADAAQQRTYFSKAWYAFTGRKPEQELGSGWLEGVHVEDRERCVATTASAAHAREPFTVHYRLRRHDGSYRRVADHGRPRLLGDGRLIGFIGECTELGESTSVLPGASEARPVTGAGTRTE